MAVLLAFLPFSPVIGGALAGAVSLVPLLLIAFLAAGFLVVVPATPGGPDPGIGGFLAVLVLTVLAVLGIYTVGGGALGGYVGSYIKEDRLRVVDAAGRET